MTFPFASFRLEWVRSVSCLCSLLALFLSASAQLYEIKEAGKWGLMDQRGQVVLAPTYDYIYPASDHHYFFLVKEGKTGLYHRSFGQVLPPEYDQIFVEADDEQALKIVIEGKYGILRPSDNARISAQYQEIVRLRKDYYALRNGKNWGLQTLHHNWKLPVQYRRIFCLENRGKLAVGAVDQQGNCHVWDESGQSLLSDVPVSIRAWKLGTFLYQSERKWGIWGKGDTALSPAIFSAIEPLGELFKVRQGQNWGLMDPEGTLRLPIQYAEIRQDSSGHYWVSDGQAWGFANPAGELIHPPRYVTAGKFEGPVSRVRGEQGYGVINQAGDTLLELTYQALEIYPGVVRAGLEGEIKQFRYDELGRPVRSRKLIIAESGKAYKFMRTRSQLSKQDQLVEYGFFQERGYWGLRDTILGKLRLPAQYDSVELFSRWGVSVVGKQSYSAKNARYALFLHNSWTLITQPIYQHFHLEDLEQAKFMRGQRKDGRYDLISLDIQQNRWGGSLAPGVRSVLPRNEPDYRLSFIGEPGDSAFRVRIKGPILRNLSTFATDGERETYLQEAEGTWGIVNQQGRLHFRGDFSYVGPTRQGGAVARIRVGRGHKWGMIDLEASVLVPFQFAYLHDPAPEAALLISRQRGIKYSFLNRQGKFLFDQLADSLGTDGRPGSVRRVGIFSEGLLPVQVGRSWGYLDEQGKVAIPAQFAAAGSFVGGLAPVKLKQSWLFINPQGEQLVKQTYQRARAFAERRSAVRKGRKWGFVDPTGKLRIKARYDKVADFQAGVAMVKKRDVGLIDSTGRTILKTKYDKIEWRGDWLYVKKQQQSGFLLPSGKWAIPLEYDGLGTPAEGMIAFQEGNLYGYLDFEGKAVIPARFRAAESFSGGLAAVMEGSNRWGFSDRSGSLQIAPQYAAAQSFEAGLAAVAGGVPRRWGAINQAGDTLIPFRYERMERLPGGWVACRTRDSLTNRAKWVYLDRYGVPRSQQQFEEIRRVPGTRLSVARVDSKELLLDETGTPLINPGYDKIRTVGKEVVVGETSNIHGLLTRQGNILLEPTYEHIHYRDGLYQIIHQGQIGYLTQQGRWIRPLTD